MKTNLSIAGFNGENQTGVPSDFSATESKRDSQSMIVMPSCIFSDSIISIVILSGKYDGNWSILYV